MNKLKKKLDEIREEFLEEIESGNFKLSDVKINGEDYRFVIESSGLAQECVLYSNNLLYSYVIQEAGVVLFNNLIKAPEILKESIEIELSEIRAKRMAELMMEYNKLARQNGEP